jgi:hypothetical protein
MRKYIVISPHTSEDCRKAVKEFREYNAGFFTHFDWGCMDKDHTAYAIFEADSHETAKMAVPALFREKTRVIMLTNFDPSKTKDRLHSA